MAKISIQYADVEVQCYRLHKIAKDIKDILSQIEAKSLAVTSSEMWVGQAADHFNNYVKNLTKNFDEIYNELDASVLYLASSAEGYGAVDSTVLNEILNVMNITDPDNYSSKVYR